MGQYYNVLTQINNRTRIYNRDIIKNGENLYTFPKLMEHSWWENEFVNSFCKTLYKNPKRVIWMGDYANDYIFGIKGETVNGYSKHILLSLYRKTWKEQLKEHSITYHSFNLNKKFLVNHSKQEYIDCSKYYAQNNSNDNWCIHPLPLMTCLGNGYGLGDYNYPSQDSTCFLVGAWAYDIISIENKVPLGCIEINPIFKEQR